MYSSEAEDLLCLSLLPHYKFVSIHLTNAAHYFHLLCILSILGPCESLMPSKTPSKTLISSNTGNGKHLMILHMDELTMSIKWWLSKRITCSSIISSSKPLKFVMHVDPHEVVSEYQHGHNSVCISSYSSYTKAVFVLDLSHMPVGCSTWLAFWTLSRMGPWLNGREIDIIEGINVNSHNLVSLHTLSDCAMPQYSGPACPYMGESMSDNCDAAFNYNTRCGIAFTKPNLYGYAFNANRYYVLARMVSAIQVWFWPRNAADVPKEILHSGNYTGHLDILEFPKPDAYFTM
ncbi:glycoside hydrolase family 16 protein [Moniliophthora roreri MCA 2997]|uniref:Glycoside hydrolase family 16 protein n=1 Tax=Moniliophthora roreri (strain MCA 2997) TaxID=1381753 RepID=V2WLJ3_MONRO|nr:glycoside hydrolase family 16 protein [Moniliophthora roreri MCA 2997]